MPRLLLFLALLTALVAAVGFAMHGLARAQAAFGDPLQEDMMSNQFRKIAYVILIVMLFSVTAGAL